MNHSGATSLSRPWQSLVYSPSWHVLTSCDRQASATNLPLSNYRSKDTCQRVAESVGGQEEVVAELASVGSVQDLNLLHTTHTQYGKRGSR